MEERHDILDEPETGKVTSSENRQRSFRYLFYAVGIGLAMLGQFWFHAYQEETLSRGTDLRVMFSLALAGIWLFAGLGLVASIRAFLERQIDVLQVGILVLHLILLLWSSTQIVEWLL